MLTALLACLLCLQNALDLSAFFAPSLSCPPGPGSLTFFFFVSPVFRASFASTRVLAPFLVCIMTFLPSLDIVDGRLSQCMSVIFLLITKLKALGLESDAISSRALSSSHVSSPPATPKGKVTAALEGENAASPTHEATPAALSPRSPRAEFGSAVAPTSNANAAVAGAAKPATGKKPHALTVGGGSTTNVAPFVGAQPNKAKRPMVPPRNKSVSSGPESATAGVTSENTVATVAPIRISEPVPTDPEERKKFYVIRIQAAARGYLARRKLSRQIKEQKEVSALFKADPAALKKLIRLQATIRGMRTRNLPVLRARRRRNEIAGEIFRTEDTYVNQLQVLVDIYMKGLEELGESVISAAKLRSIFSDIKVILGYNNVILKMLTERTKTWYTSGQAVGDIFGKLADFLKTYTAYVNNYNESMNVLQDQMMNNPAFAAKINECRMNERVKGMEITSFLIMPIQRLPRYVMLLSDLFKNTPESHIDYERLIVALKKVEGVASYVNTKKREAENLLGVTTVARHLVGLESMAEFTQPHRRYVRQGFLQETDATSISLKALRTRYFFAFNDILVGTKESTGVLSRSKIPANGFDIDGLRDSDAQFKYLYRFPLLGALINELPEQNKVTNMFELVQSPTPLVIQSAAQQSSASNSSASNGTGDSTSTNGGTSSTATSTQGSAPQKLILVAPTPQLKDEWIHDLDEIVMTCLEKHRSRIGVTPAEERTTLPDNLRTPTFTGILHKRTESGEWKKNYFVLCADVLMYYPNVQAGMNPESTVVPKKIPLILASVMSVPLMDRSYSMRLFTKERVYILSADTAHERMQWVNMIRAAIAKRLVEIEARQRQQNEANLQAHTAAHATQHTSLIGGSVAGGLKSAAESPQSTPAASTKVSKRDRKEKEAAAAAGNDAAPSSKDAQALGIIAMVAAGSSPAPATTNASGRESPRKRSESTTPATEKKSRKKDKEKTASIGKTGKAKTLSGATSAAVAAELKSQSSSPAPTTSSDEQHENGTHSEEGTAASSEGKNGKTISRSSSKKEKEEKEKKSTLRKKKKAAAEEGGSEEQTQKIFKSGEVYKFSSGSEKVVKQKMTLQDGTLKLYKSSKSKAVQSINLLLVQPVSSHLETTTVKETAIHQFTLITPERKFVFGCDSEEEANSWIETIQLAHEALGR